MKKIIQILALSCWPLLANAEPQPASDSSHAAPQALQEQPAPKIGASAAAQIEGLERTNARLAWRD
jgi:hypothetical protein